MLSSTTRMRLGWVTTLAAALLAGSALVPAPADAAPARTGASPTAQYAGDAGAAQRRALRDAARMGPADPRNPDNPLAGLHWGVYKGNADPAWPAYVHARGATKRALAKIALRPKAKFFGDWIADSQIRAKMRDYISNSSKGHPGAMIQLALFRMVPWEGEACHRLPSAAEQASYKRYISIVANTLGSRHAAVVLQPDGPFLDCVPHHSPIPARLLAYAARTLEAKPNVSVYIEMGSADWFRDDPARPVRMLIASGVKYTRGFALDTSHFDSVGRQIRFGTKIVKALQRRGLGTKHFVIDTSDSGHAFTGAWWHKRHGHQPLGNALPCSSAGQTHCIALGIPPTTDVASTAWGLSDTLRNQAGTHVDGYLWISRPWLDHQSGPFVLTRALREIRYSPF